MYLILKSDEDASSVWISSFNKLFKDIKELVLEYPFSDYLKNELRSFTNKNFNVIIIASSSGKTCRGIKINGQNIRVDNIINEMDHIFGQRIGCFYVRSSYALDRAHKTWLSKNHVTIAKHVRIFGFYDKIKSRLIEPEEKYLFKKLEKKPKKKQVFQQAYSSICKQHDSWVSIHGFTFYDQDTDDDKKLKPERKKRKLSGIQSDTSEPQGRGCGNTDEFSDSREHTILGKDSDFHVVTPINSQWNEAKQDQMETESTTTTIFYSEEIQWIQFLVSQSSQQ